MKRIRSVLIASVAFTTIAMGMILILTGSDDPAEVSRPVNIPAEPPTREELVFQKYSDYIHHTFDSLKTVGAAYTIVYKGEIALTETLGLRNKNFKDAVDEHTIFRLASVSKGFAGVLAAILEDEKEFSLDDPVKDYYPGFRLKDSSSTDSLLISHLLSHTTGLVPHAFDNLVESGVPLSDIIDRLNEVDIHGPPGEFYGYQNVLFSMIDPIAQECTGESYPDLLQSEIFDPLEMNDAFAGIIDTGLYANVAFPHLKGRSGYFPVKLHQGYYNVLPAAGVNASISDMGKWLQALLGYEDKTLSEDILNKISTPIIYTPLKWQYTRYWKSFKERYYSLGWRIYDYKGRRIIYHGGYVRGYRAEIAFCPAENVGMAFLQNSPNSLASKSVPMFLDLFFEEEKVEEEKAETIP